MRRPILPIAFALALITGAWFGQAYAFFAPPDPISASDTNDAAAEAAVWRFYDAIGLLLRTGETTSIRDAIAPDYVDHADRPGLPPTGDGLIDYLLSLRRTHPTLALAPKEIVVQGDRVVAHVERTGDAEGSVLGIPLAGTRPWASVDIFRLAGGRIAEHWGDPTGAILATPLVSDSVVLPGGPNAAPLLERVTYAPSASDRDLNRHGPAVVLVETGLIAIDRGTGDEITLEPGDTFVVPAGEVYATRNPSAAPAVALVLNLMTPWPSVYPMDPPPPPPPGITIQPLAGGAAATTRPGPHTVTIGRVTLGSGAQLASHQLTGTELLVVDGGTLTATLSGNSAGAWLLLPNQYATIAHPIEQIEPETGLTVLPGSIATYRNDAPRLLSLLLVSVTPTLGPPPTGI